MSNWHFSTKAFVKAIQCNSDKVVLFWWVRHFEWVSERVNVYPLVFTLRVLSANHAVGCCRIQFHPQSTKKRAEPERLFTISAMWYWSQWGSYQAENYRKGFGSLHTYTTKHKKGRRRAGGRGNGNEGQRSGAELRKLLMTQPLTPLCPLVVHTFNPKGGVECS